MDIRRAITLIENPHRLDEKRVAVWSGATINVYHNPSLAAFKTLTTKVEVLRGLLSDDGTDLYLWDAYMAVHPNIMQELGLGNYDCISYNRGRWNGPVHDATRDAYKPAIERLTPKPKRVYDPKELDDLLAQLMDDESRAEDDEPLIESLDTVVPWRWTRHSRIELEAAFTIGTTAYVVSIFHEHGGVWVVNFGAQAQGAQWPSQHVTGTGNAGTVYATVIDVIVQFEDELGDAVTALKIESDLTERNRHRMNLHVAKRLVQLLAGDYVIEDEPEDGEILLQRMGEREDEDESERALAESGYTPSRTVLSKEELLARGAGGHLDRAIEAYIPLDKVDGREPVPAAADDEGYWKGRPILQPIEVAYDRSSDTYILYAGNHRVHQAEINGDSHILAFVQPDGGRIGLKAISRANYERVHPRGGR